MRYDHYNREERALCSHLFRLLHEGLANTPERSALVRVVERLRGKLSTPPLPEREDTTALGRAAIFTEVALIRDAYFHRKPKVGDFMDELVQLVARQERASQFRKYTELPAPLQDPKQTHPKQIFAKAEKQGLFNSEEEARVYRSLQGMFNAKPDLALVFPTGFVLFEAKFTEAFDREQMTRARHIAEVWAKVLYRDLGYDQPPPFAVATLGDGRAGVDLSWQALLEVVRDFYPENDRTRLAFEAGVALLGRT